jgi:hypothetical protein
MQGRWWGIDYFHNMGFTLASILSAILLLVILFLIGRFLLRLVIRSKGKKYFIPVVILSIAGFAVLLCVTPGVWYLLSILLSGEDFGR